MPLTFRRDKQLPLTSDEVDNNFQELLDQINELKASLPQNSLVSIKQEGRKLIFQGPQGVTFPPVDLPVITWTPKGLWKEDVSYAAYDVVQYKDSLWLCTTPHTSPKENSSDYWEKQTLKQGSTEWALVFKLS